VINAQPLGPSTFTEGPDFTGPRMPRSIRTRVAVIVIGRNEGLRLGACLASLAGESVIYTDSGSVDGSPAVARAAGAQVVELAPPYSAARGRNAALAALHADMPEYVQFIDGDCELDAGWLAEACKCLDANPATAAVAGILSERHPESSIYNRLCNLEWQAPAGRTLAVGGIALYRTAALAQTGPFDPDIAAGEEPELCLRLRDAGWTLRRIDVLMARHDANLLRFGQWWRRVVRGGCGAMEVYLYTRGKIFGPLVRRAWMWGFMLPLLGIGLAALLALLGNVAIALSVALVLAAVYIAQAARMAWQGMRQGLTPSDAAAFGALSVISKLAEMWGIIQHLKRAHRRRTTRKSARHAFPL
jgi:GT2 family glycosyltransferase